MTDQVDDGVGVEETKLGTSLRRAPSAVAEPREQNLVLPAPTSGIVVGHVGIDIVGMSAEIVSVRSLAGSLDPLLFRLEFLTLGPGGEFFSRGLLPLCFKVPGCRLVAVLLRLAPRCIGRDCGSTPHDDDSTRHGGGDNDNDHDDDDNGHVHKPYTTSGFTMVAGASRAARTGTKRWGETAIVRRERRYGLPNARRTHGA